MKLSKIEFIADWQRVMGSDTALSTDTVLEYINLRAQADARPFGWWYSDKTGEHFSKRGPDSYAPGDLSEYEVKVTPLYTHPAEASAPGLSEADRNVIESAILEVELSCQYALAEDLRAILTRASAATVAEPRTFMEKWSAAIKSLPMSDQQAAQQQAEPESVIKRQAQKIAELIADRDSWIEAHARLYRLYHDQSPRAGEEIHVNVEGGDVYTLPLQRSGMDKPRFVVHVPRPQQAEPHPSQAHPTFQTVSLPNGPGTPSAQTFDRRIACKAGKPEWKSCAQQAEPGADERSDSLEFRLRDAIKGMANCIADPMWPSHAEVSKANLKRWHKLLHDLRAAQSGQRVGVALLADEHKGMRVDYQGLFKQARAGLRREPFLAEMLRQFQDHVTELGRRWYAGDTAVVDELLQLYCVEREARAAIAVTSANLEGQSNG